MNKWVSLKQWSSTILYIDRDTKIDRDTYTQTVGDREAERDAKREWQNERDKER